MRATIVSCLVLGSVYSLNAQDGPLKHRHYCTEIGAFNLTFDEDEVSGAYYLKDKAMVGGMWAKLDSLVATGRWHDADGKGDIILTFTEDYSYFTADYRSDKKPDKWYKDTWHGTLVPKKGIESFERDGKTYQCY